MKSKKFVATTLMTSGLILSSTALAVADSSPQPTTTSNTVDQGAHDAYKAALAQYKIALTQYRVALINNDINYRAAMEKYWSDWSAINLLG